MRRRRRRRQRALRQLGRRASTERAGRWELQWLEMKSMRLSAEEGLSKEALTEGRNRAADGKVARP